MTATRVRIGQVGVANHGATILNAIQAAGNLSLVSLFDTDAAACSAAANATGARIATGFDDLVNDPGIDAVALVTPNHLHCDEVIAAARVGKHVFVEKPIGNTIAEGRAMIAAMHEARMTLMVGHNTRRRKVFRRAKELLDQGTLGTYVGVEANVSRPAGILPGLPTWKADPARCPLLPMMQLGIHFVDTIAYLLSPVRRVSCLASNVAMPGGVFDATAALLMLDSGIPVVLSSYYVSPDAYFLRIYGTRGLLHCGPTSLRLERVEGGVTTGTTDEDFSTEGAESYILQMREFGECVLTGRAPETGGEEGLRALAVIEAMTQSVARAAVIDVQSLLN
ncbi:MAG: Gfo/Idh/MocA family oxidoreductase [Bacteroidota bacterium]